MKRYPRSSPTAAANAKQSDALPAPEAAALAASTALRQRIIEEIERAAGWISFAHYMELALYEPELGYYMSGARKFGAGGDFVTAPEMTPLFGRALARQVAQIMRLSQPHVLELGAGSGALAVDVLSELERLQCPAQRYFILELSAELRARQRATLTQRAPALLERVRWLDRLPETFSGVMLANEVFDALPVHVVAWREDAIYERGVGMQGGRFVWRECAADPALLDAARKLQVAHEISAPYVSEIGLVGSALAASLTSILRQGCLFISDYGFVSEQYYHPQRRTGTLMCHYRQRAHDDAFFLPGAQDITAHVDFSALAAAATQLAGAQTLGYVNQAQFLIHCGITELLAELDAADAARYLPQAAQVQKLLSPAEMGELFKVIALGRGVGEPLLGFAPAR